MRLPGPLCVTTALPSDPGTRNVGYTISPVERHAHLVHGRSPSNQRQHKPEPPRSILEISAGNPFKTYPETLSVSPDLIKLDHGSPPTRGRTSTKIEVRNRRSYSGRLPCRLNQNAAIWRSIQQLMKSSAIVLSKQRRQPSRLPNLICQ